MDGLSGDFVIKFLDDREGTLWIPWGGVLANYVSHGLNGASQVDVLQSGAIRWAALQARVRCERISHDERFSVSVLPWPMDEALAVDGVQINGDVEINALGSELESAVLFGSLARDDRDFRDADLLFVVPNKKDKAQLHDRIAERFESVRRRFATPVSAVVVTKAETAGPPARCLRTCVLPVTRMLIFRALSD